MKVTGSEWYVLDAQAGKTPFMGKIVVPECKCFPAPMDDRGAGKIHPYPVIALIFGQNLLYSDSNEFPVPVPKAEPDRRNLSVCVRTRDHLHRNINTQYAFHSSHSFSGNAVHLS